MQILGIIAKNYANGSFTGSRILKSVTGFGRTRPVCGEGAHLDPQLPTVRVRFAAVKSDDRWRADSFWHFCQSFPAS